MKKRIKEGVNMSKKESTTKLIKEILENGKKYNLPQTKKKK